MFSRRPGICLFSALLNLVTWCLPAVCPLLCCCARWAIRNMFITCWAATHSIAATLPHVVGLPLTPFILATAFEVLVTMLLTGVFCRLAKNKHVWFVLYCSVFAAGLVVSRMSLKKHVESALSCCVPSLCSLPVDLKWPPLWALFKETSKPNFSSQTSVAASF